MENVIQVDDKYALAFGFTWVTLDPIESRSSQLTNFRTEYQAKWYATIKVNGSENIGHAKNLTIPKKLKVLSAAGQLATHARFIGQSVLLLLEDDNHVDTSHADNDVAVIGLLNGNVIIDVFVKASQVQKLRQDFLDQCVRASVEFMTIGHVLTINQVEQEFTWQNLLPEKNRTTKWSLSNKTKQVIVKPLKKDIPGWILWITVLLLLFCAFGYYYQAHAEEKERLRMLMLSKQQPNPENIYRDSVNSLLASDFVLAETIAKTIKHDLKTFPTELAGWRLEKIFCDVQSGCIATWNRKFGTFKEFIARAPSTWGKISIGSDRSKLSHAIPITYEKKKLDPKDKWPLDRDLRIIVVSQWQKYESLKFDAIMNPVSLIGVPPSVQPQLAASSPYATWAASWEIRGAPWWTMEAVENFPNNMVFESAEIIISDEVRFNMKGTAYVQK